MESGYKFMPKEEFLVGNVLRMRLRGEPLDGVSAHCIREADVYGDDPVRLTSLFPPTNREPCEWFFFSWSKLKSKKAHGGGGGGGRKNRVNRVKKRRKDRTVRGAGGIEIGHWRSTQSIKNVIQIDGSNCGVTIGYHQNFEYRDSKKQKSEWLMEEYGILPSSENAADDDDNDDDKELVICKIYKTPSAKRAEAKKSVPSPAEAFLIPSSPGLPSQHLLPQKYYPCPESLQPPSPSSVPSQPAVVIQNWPNPAAPSPAGAGLPSQHLFPQQYYPWPESLQPPPPTSVPSQPAVVLQNWPNPAAPSPAGAGFPSQHLLPQQYFPWPESLQPPPPPSGPSQPAVVIQNWSNPAAHVCDDSTLAISHISQSSTAELNGNIILPPAEQQQQREHAAELDVTANTYPEDPQLQERSVKRRKILGTFGSLFATSTPHRPTIRRAPTIAR